MLKSEKEEEDIFVFHCYWYIRIKEQQQDPFKTITHVDELKDGLRLFQFSSLHKKLSILCYICVYF